jgi:bacillithiol system protein YtxJ
MDDAFLLVPDVAALERLFAASRAAPVLLFNHDPGCGGSCRAYGRLRELRRDHGAIGLIDVRVAREVTAELARRTGVRHESPQVLLLRDGRAAWSASHGAVMAAAVERALAALAAER